MSSLTQATRVKRLQDKRDDGVVVYEAEINDKWSVFGNPHGGYLLAVLTTALSDHQRQSKPYHPDPGHITATFYTGTKPGRSEVHVKVTRTGKSWTNLEARIVQDAQTTVLVQALYTLMSPLPTSNPHPPYSTSNQNLLPLTPSPYARRTPFVVHPSTLDPEQLQPIKEKYRRWSGESIFWFLPKWMKFVEDPGVKQRREEGDAAGKKQLEWGAWCRLTDQKDEVTSELLPFFSDMMSSIPELMPGDERIAPHYYPTLAMSLQFHAKLPFASDSPYLSSRNTVGCWSTGHHISQGRHEQLVEVWSAPSELGAGSAVESDWQQRSMLLVSSTQIALCVPIQKLIEAREKQMAKEAKL